MNAPIAMAKRLSVASNAIGQESGLWDFTPVTVKNAQERENTLVLCAAGQPLLQHRHDQPDLLIRCMLCRMRPNLARC